MTNANLRSRYKSIEGSLYKGNVENAVKSLNSNRSDYSKEDQVLYELDRGILAYYMGDDKNAIKFLEKADRRIEENYTESISKAVLSAISNDYAMDYAGENYESVYVNVFKALVYIRQNNADAARVEIRRMTEKFKDFAVRYNEEIEALKGQGLKSQLKKLNPNDFPFIDSALGRYLSLILYRADGDVDDAQIDKNNLLGIIEGRQELYRGNAKNESIQTEPTDGKGLVNIVAFCDKGPYKYAWELEALAAGNSITVSGRNPTFRETFHFLKHQDLSFKFSIPKIRERKNEIETVNVYVNNVLAAKTYELEDFGRVAVNTFNNNNTPIIIKSVLRGIGKAITAKELTKDWDKTASGKSSKKKKNSKNKSKKKEKEPSEGDKLLASLFSSLTKAAINSTEQADLRCWRLMPDRAEVAEVELPYGTHNITLEFVGRNGTIRKRLNKTITVSADQPLNLVSAYAF